MKGHKSIYAWTHREAIAVGVVILGAVALSMLSRWEMTAEAWGYWFFARVFSETNTFMVLDRSPLYALYLNLFTWMGYPTSVTVQYLVSGAFAVASIVVLFRKYLGLKTAVFAGVLWIPYLLQFAEPPVQMISLGVTCLAVVARQAGTGRLYLAISYALLGVAMMLRPTYIVAIGIFAAWDAIKILNKGGFGTLFLKIRPQRTDWPVGVVLILFAGFAVMQSPHPWNNVWTSTTKWTPGDGKSLADSAFIQNFSVAYILRRYGSFEGKDFYFTNREIFGDATTMVGAIRANPSHVVGQVGMNIARLPGALLQITEFPKMIYPISSRLKEYQGSHSLVLLGLVYLALSIGILYGAFRAARDESMILFLVTSSILTGVTALSYVKARWMYPMIPVLLMSAHWYGVRAHQWLAPRISNLLLKSRERNEKRRQRVSYAGSFFIAAFLVLFSNGASSWAGILSSAASDFHDGRPHVLEQKYLASMKASFSHWHPLIRNCKGVMTLESTFTAAFVGIPVNRIYDIWEIPPFGHLNNSEYDGLRPDRIDCVLVSMALSTEVGGGTNIKIRYENYVRPYVEQLQKMGAVTHEVPHFGQAVVLEKRSLDRME